MDSGGPPGVNNVLVQHYVDRYTSMNMLATVEIARQAGDPGVDPQDPNRSVVLPVIPIYLGRGRVYTVSGGGGLDFSADEDAAFSSSYISVPREVAGVVVESMVNDLIKVLEHEDTEVVGRVFRVLDVDAGGQWPGARRHMVTGAAKYENWVWADVRR